MEGDGDIAGEESGKVLGDELGDGFPADHVAGNVERGSGGVALRAAKLAEIRPDRR
ncbi:MAG TPA: hypothetical protein VK735_38155 [Pseudonocardia sp.]|uniref:hypothetical protein n=1 Tax=Pseudonocardia sp. TaxID=60912 RepID=UPI002BC0E7B6|nr:hypothetical protein [Pseudonocardia sp.]HTF53305.1 hypothetical protein [Pseudonocardia sp.]